MKIEKINDNKIRCTLTSADLAERNLKLSELAYGTERSKELKIFFTFRIIFSEMKGQTLFVIPPV